MPVSRRCHRTRRDASADRPTPSARHSAVIGFALKGPYFNGQRVGAVTEHGGQSAPPDQSAVKIGRLDDKETADVLLAFGVRAVGHQDVAPLEAYDGRRGRWVEPAVEDPGAGCFGLLDQGVDTGHDLIHARHDLWRRWSIGLVDAEQIVLHVLVSRE